MSVADSIPVLPDQSHTTARYTTTFEDFREANPAAAKRRSWRNRISWVILIVCSIVVFFLASTLNRNSSISSTAGFRTDAPPEHRPIVSTLVSLSPVLLLTLIYVLVMIRNATLPPAPPWGRPQGAAVVFGFVIRLLGMAASGIPIYVVISFTLDQAGAPSLLGNVTDAERSALMIQWLVMMSTNFLGQFTAAGTLVRQWESQPTLHREFSLDAGEDGIYLDTDGATWTYRWDKLPGFRETKNLIILYVSAHAYWMIPKRGFSGDAALDRFKSLIINHGLAGTFQVPPLTAFPVPPFARVHV